MTGDPTKTRTDGPLLARRYRLLTQVGRGGMGTVWQAHDEVLGRDVAVKEVILPHGLSDDERSVQYKRTFREARTAARLGHPGVVTVYDVVEEDGRPWIIMELIKAPSLDQVIKGEGPFPARRAADIGRQMLAALHAAHTAGVLHRDVKPSNVLIAPGDRAVLTDFGIATAEGDVTLTQTGLVMGSPAYIAPERARGKTAGPFSDLWSLGVTLYAMIDGRSPFERSEPMASLVAIISENPRPPAAAGPLEPVIEGLLRKDPDQRMNAREAGVLLDEIVQEESVNAEQTTPVPAPPEGLPAESPQEPGGPVIGGTPSGKNAGRSGGRASRRSGGTAGRGSGKAPARTPARSAAENVLPAQAQDVREQDVRGQDPRGERDGAGKRNEGEEKEGEAGRTGDAAAATETRADVARPAVIRSLAARWEAARAGAAQRESAQPESAQPESAQHSAGPRNDRDGRDDLDGRQEEAGDGVGAGRQVPAADEPGSLDAAAEGPADAASATIVDSGRFADQIARARMLGLEPDSGRGGAAPDGAGEAGTTKPEQAQPESEHGEPERGEPERREDVWPGGARHGDGGAPARLEADAPQGWGRTLLVVLAIIAIALAILGVMVLVKSKEHKTATMRGTPARVVAGRSGSPAGSGGTGTAHATALAKAVSASGTPASGGTPGAVPEGFRSYRDPSGFSAVVPKDWSGPEHKNSSVYFRSPGSSAYLQFDHQDKANRSALTDWRRSAASASFSGYREIRLAPVTGGAPVSDPTGAKAADWEFTWGRSGDLTHVLDRGFVMHGHGYAILLSVPESDWDRTFRDLQPVYVHFTPAD